jgi:hypothetical protein
MKKLIIKPKVNTHKEKIAFYYTIAEYGKILIRLRVLPLNSPLIPVLE